MGTLPDDIAFLTGSPNRAAVLEALATNTRDRHALQADLGISQPTASRILHDLRERDWVTRTGDIYELTPVGGAVVDAYTDFRNRMDAIDHLREIIPLIPEADYDIDLSQLVSADIIRVRGGEGNPRLTHEIAQYTAGDHVRILTDRTPSAGVEAVRQQVIDEGLHLEAVIEQATIERLRRDPELRRWHHDLLDVDRARLYDYDGSVPAPLILVDDTVNLALRTPNEAEGVWVTSRDPEVFAWAEAIFERYRRRARALTADDISP